MKIIVILLFAYAMLCWVSDRIIKQREQHSPADEEREDEILIDYDFYFRKRLNVSSRLKT